MHHEPSAALVTLRVTGLFQDWTNQRDDNTDKCDKCDKQDADTHFNLLSRVASALTHTT
jgi:hypothetical protein